jgi:hypothetical protein
MFRFTIRDLLWLTVVVGLAIALWQSRAATIYERSNAANWSSKANAALTAIQTRGPAAWNGNGVVVTETNESGAKYLKIYRDK